MPEISFRGRRIQVAPGETVLDALLRSGEAVGYSCRSGVCQSCLLQAQGCAVPAAAQQGLKETQREAGYFLACVCVPEEPLTVREAGGDWVKATVSGLDRLSPTVLRLRLLPEGSFPYRSGQYASLRRPDGLIRSYSLASLPEEPELEFHIRRAEAGRMSGWLFDEAREGEAISIRGPAGDCFYVAGRSEQPLLLAGTGTGLAPLAGIARDALAKGHTGPIRLYHGALAEAGLYLREEMRELAERHSNFDYHPVVLHGNSSGEIRTGGLAEAIASDTPKLGGWRGYACGDPAIVTRLRKSMFLAGMASREIYSDSFVEAAVP